MPKSLLHNMRHAGLISALVMAPCLAINAGVVSAETIQAQLAKAPNVPPPITRTQPATVVVNLEANEWVGPLSDDNNYEFWGFNKTVPGPMIRVMVGDTVEIRLKNKAARKLTILTSRRSVAEQPWSTRSPGRKLRSHLRPPTKASLSISPPLQRLPTYNMF